MGLFDQDDIPIIQSIIGGGNGLNNYGAGDRYGGLDPYNTGAQPIPTDVSGATAQLIPPATGMPAAMPVSSPTPAATPVVAPQAAGQVPMPTSAFQPGPQSPTAGIGLQPGSPAPPMAAPINVGAGPGAGYPTQPPMRRPIGAPGMVAGGPASSDPSTKANWLGKALGITSPQQGQSIASQFLSGLGAGMSAAGQYANKPAGAAFAGPFGAAMQAAQARGDTQGQRAFELMKFQAAQQQQDRMNKLLERKQNYAEQHGNVSDLLNTYREIDNRHLSAARAGRYDAAAAWDNRRATQENSKVAWQLSPTGKAHQIQVEANNALTQQRIILQSLYKDNPDKLAEEWEKAKAKNQADIEQAYKDRGVDLSKVTKGTQDSPHEPSAWVQTRAWDPGTVYKAPEDYKDANGTLHKKGTLTTRGVDEYNTPLGPRPQTPQEYPQQQMPISEEQPAAGPSDAEILAAANG